MKKAKRIVAAVFLFGWLGLFAETAASQISCPTQIPAGTVIRIFPDERILAGRTSGPMLFTVASDVRLFLNRPPILPRGTKVIADMEESKQAGRLWGRAKAQVVFRSILTSDFCEYSINATLLEAAEYDIDEETIVGKGHPWRDLFAFLFPPTTVYQLIRTPARGPKLIVDDETALTIKLLEPVFPVQSRTSAYAPNVSRADQVPLSSLEQSTAPKSEEASTEEGDQIILACPERSQTRIRSRTHLAVTRGGRVVLRPFKNTTPYEAVIHANGVQVGRTSACSESELVIPGGNLRLQAFLWVPEERGQRQVEADLELNDMRTGWRVSWPQTRSSR
jgi:hypothetical protein